MNGSILIVDDTPASLDLLEGLLTDAGHDVRSATSGKLAVRSAHAELPALILLDVRMPGMDGFEVCRQLKVDERTRSVPIIFVSALEDEAARLTGLRAGAVDYISKPFHAEEVLARVQTHLALRRAQLELERSNRELRAARDEAERAGRAKDTFLAALSHELRTPLSAILGWAELCAARESTPERLREVFRKISRNARTQARLIDELLETSRIIAGKVGLELQLVDLGQIVDAALDSVRPTADAKGVRLERCLGGTATPGLVNGDVTRLSQVVSNLLTNSLKFTPAGGFVRVALRRAVQSAEIEVADSGIGIAKGFLPQVFEPFCQADASTTRRQAGLGLGLAIVRNLVELHGGTVRAESAGENQGAVFTVTLPLARAGIVAPIADRSEERPGAGPAPDLTGVRVLVVDDEEDAREIIASTLRERHAQVKTVPSAEDALVALRQEVPSVLISDIVMPGEDGYSLIRKVRALPPGQGGDVPALALTALARPDDSTRAVFAGYQIHRAKPVALDALAADVALLARRPQPVARHP